MREDMRDLAGMPPVRRQRAPRFSVVSPSLRARPGGCRHFAHAAEQALVRPRAQQDGAVVAHRHEGRAAPQRLFGFFGALTGKRSGSPDCSARQSSRSGHSMQRGRFGVQIVAPRSIIAWAKSPGRPAGISGSSSVRMTGLASGSGVAMAKQPRHHPLDIAVDHGRRPVEGDRRDGRRRIGADAGQLAQSGLACRGNGFREGDATISAHFFRLRARE